jgi:hypothetical protein
MVSLLISGGRLSMSVARFCARVAGAKLNEADKKGFPRWIRSYASSLKITEGDLRVTEADVIAFSRSLRDHKTPAWQRLQAVRAVEAYRDLVLRSDERFPRTQAFGDQ